MNLLDWLIHGSCGPNLPEICMSESNLCTCQPGPFWLIIAVGIAGIILLAKFIHFNLTNKDETKIKEESK